MIPALVPTQHWHEFWPAAEPLLRAAFEHGGDYAVEDAPERLESGEWGLWIVVERGALVAAGVAEIVQFPQRRKCWVIAYGGDGAGLRLLWPLLRQAALDAGCSAVAFSGRRGWLRSGLLPAGAAHRADIVEVPL